MVQENNKHHQTFFFVEHAIYASPLLHSSFPPAQPIILCHYSVNSSVNLPGDLVKEFQVYYIFQE